MYFQLICVLALVYVICSAVNEIPTNSTKCPPNVPYCENGICSTFPENCFSKKNSMDFLCTSAGVFPEPTDCKRYHYCSTADSTSIQYECPNGNIFNSKLKLCQKGGPWGIHSSRKICEKITCNYIRNEFIIFPANPTYYVFCHASTNGIHQIVMYKCENEESYFDIKTKNCSFNCQSAGYFPDSTDCSAYYICDGYKRYFSRRVSCPPGYFFNGKACVNSVAHCPLESLIVTTTVLRSTQPTTQTPSTKSSTAVTTEYSTQLSTDLATVPFESILTFPYPSILYLPCPMWIQNQQICARNARLRNFIQKN